MWAGLEGGARAGGWESSAPPGASLVAEAHQRTHLGGKLALGAVRGPSSGSRAIGSGRLRSMRLATCLSAAARSAPTAGTVVP